MTQARPISPDNARLDLSSRHEFKAANQDDLFQTMMAKAASPELREVIIPNSLCQFTEEQRKRIFFTVCDNPHVKTLVIHSKTFVAEFYPFFLETLAANQTLVALELKEFANSEMNEIAREIGNKISITQLSIDIAMQQDDKPCLANVMRCFPNIECINIASKQRIFDQIVSGLEYNDSLCEYKITPAPALDGEAIAIDEMLAYNKLIREREQNEIAKLQRLALPIFAIVANRAIANTPAEKNITGPRPLAGIFNTEIRPKIGAVKSVNAKKISTPVGLAAVIQLLQSILPEGAGPEFKMTARKDESGRSFVEILSSPSNLKCLRELNEAKLDKVDKSKPYFCIDEKNEARGMLWSPKEFFARVQRTQNIFGRSASSSLAADLRFSFRKKVQNRIDGFMRTVDSHIFKKYMSQTYLPSLITYRDILDYEQKLHESVMADVNEMREHIPYISLNAIKQAVAYQKQAKPFYRAYGDAAPVVSTYIDMFNEIKQEPESPYDFIDEICRILFLLPTILQAELPVYPELEPMRAIMKQLSPVRDVLVLAPKLDLDRDSVICIFKHRNHLARCIEHIKFLIAYNRSDLIPLALANMEKVGCLEFLEMVLSRNQTMDAALFEKLYEGTQFNYPLDIPVRRMIDSKSEGFHAPSLPRAQAGNSLDLTRSLLEWPGPQHFPAATEAMIKKVNDLFEKNKISEAWFTKEMGLYLFANIYSIDTFNKAYQLCRSRIKTQEDLTRLFTDLRFAQDIVRGGNPYRLAPHLLFPSELQANQEASSPQSDAKSPGFFQQGAAAPSPASRAPAGGPSIQPRTTQKSRISQSAGRFH